MNCLQVSSTKGSEGDSFKQEEISRVKKQNGGGTNGGSKSSGSDDFHNCNQNKWGASKNGYCIKLLEISLCVDVEIWIVVGTLSMPQTFMVLMSTTQLLITYLTLIPT